MISLKTLSSKRAYFLSFSLICFLAVPASACAKQDTMTRVPVDEVIILGQDIEVHNFTKLSTTMETYFCEGHIAKIEVTSRTEIGARDTFRTHDVSIEFDGKNRDMDLSAPDLESYTHLSGIGDCVNESLTIRIYGFDDSGAKKASLVSKTKFTW